MTMAACYANYDMSLSQGVPQHQQHHQVHHVPVSMHQQGRMSGAVSAAPNVTPQKDYSTPLHVDCSVEYELPNQPKPPAGQRVEPLLMIHPCYFRKMESQRRSPFVNNMPNSSRSNMNALSASSSSSVTTSSSSSSSRRITRQSQVLVAQQQVSQQQQQHHRHQQQAAQSQHQAQQTQHYHQQLTQQLQQQQMSQMSQQAHYPSVTSVQQHQPSSSSTAQQYIEQARRAVIHSHSQSRNHHQNQSQSQVQSSSSSWDQIAAAAAVATSMPAAAGIVGLPAAVTMTGQSMYSKPVGKRDAMLSGGCGVYSSATLHNSHTSHSTSGPNAALSTNNNSHACINNNNLSNCAAEVTLSNLRWDLPDRSPMATVPSNYQAGPDSTPTIMRDDKHTLSEKYRRQYLRSHRLHPYMMTAGAVGSTFPQLTATAFPQMQQVSCFNV
ncbi:centrosomal and chromosomal factor [Hermetia illucens]|uniref:centrosomal and chromosomal factor n=1 Tax=Hermetia illucens TaxID=343691 RepID=UPI0018CC23E8|nr:centrosomal and chromosomal factor [Hermetia illucens]